MNHIVTAALILWVISGVAYRKARRSELRMPKVTITPLSIEDQLDIDIHRTQIIERYPFCKVVDGRPHFKQGTWELTS